VRLSTIIIGDGVVGSLWTLLRAQFEIMEPLMIWIGAQIRNRLCRGSLLAFDQGRASSEHQQGA
jgi:hypothetical protein